MEPVGLHHTLISYPLRCSRATQPLASLSPTISSFSGSHFSVRFNRSEMFAKWQASCSMMGKHVGDWQPAVAHASNEVGHVGPLRAIYSSRLAFAQLGKHFVGNRLVGQTFDRFAFLVFE